MGKHWASKWLLFALAAIASASTLVLAFYLIRFPGRHQPWFWPDMGGELVSGSPNQTQLAQGIEDQNTYVFLFIALFGSALVAGLLWLASAKRIRLTLIAGVPTLLGHLSVAGFLAWGSMWAIDSAVEEAGHFIGHSPEGLLHNAMSLASFFAWLLFGFATIGVFIAGVVRLSRSSASRRISA